MDFLQRFSTGGFTFDALLKFTDLDRRVQVHIQKVYATLAVALVLSAFGAYLHLLVKLGGTLTALASLFCIFGLAWTPSSSSTLTRRYSLLAGTAFFQGCTIGPLLEAVLQIHPPLIFTALFLTFIVFSSFAGAALMAKRRSMLYLGSFCSIGLFSLTFVRFASALFGSSVLGFQLELYFGLILFSTYVLVDTQMMVERASAGDMDHIKAALELLLDFLNIFVRILAILARKEDNDERRKGNKRRHD